MRLRRLLPFLLLAVVSCNNNARISKSTTDDSKALNKTSEELAKTSTSDSEKAKTDSTVEAEASGTITDHKVDDKEEAIDLRDQFSKAAIASAINTKISESVFSKSYSHVEGAKDLAKKEAIHAQAQELSDAVLASKASDSPLEDIGFLVSSDGEYAINYFKLKGKKLEVLNKKTCEALFLNDCSVGDEADLPKVEINEFLTALSDCPEVLTLPVTNTDNLLAKTSKSMHNRIPLDLLEERIASNVFENGSMIHEVYENELAKKLMTELNKESLTKKVTYLKLKVITKDEAGEKLPEPLYVVQELNTSDGGCVSNVAKLNIFRLSSTLAQAII